MRVGNKLIGIPGELGAGAEFGIATQRSEFGFRLPISFDFATSNSDGIDLPEADNLGLYARGNIENLFSTNTDFHGLIGFSFYSPSVGNVLSSPKDLESDSTKWGAINDSTENINILDSYALFGATVQVPVNAPFIGRLTATPGIHYIKIAHRLKDKRYSADDDLYERLYYNQMFEQNDSTLTFNSEKLNDENESFTSLSSFYLRFDLLGKIGEKPNFIERLSFLDFIKISNVPFYEVSLQFIPGFNTISTLNVNFSDQFGMSLTRLSSDDALKGNWMPESKLWFGFNYRANF